MGLDSVELVMVVEESYDISISDGDAEKLKTVGLLHDYVMAALKNKGRTDLDSQTVFFELRKLISHQLHVSPERVVRPAGSASLASLGAGERGRWAS
jgi:hypothetical protein